MLGRTGLAPERLEHRRELVGRGVAGQRAAEERLRQEAVEKYRAVVEQSMVGIYITQEEELVYVNPKLADLVILSADPSADIANSDTIERVMLGGRLYDAKTLNEVGTGTATRKPHWWEGEGASGAAGSQRTTSEGRGHADGDAG